MQHSQGLVAKVKYVPTEDNFYTGILGSGSDTVLMRFSESGFLHEESEGLTPSVAFKFLKDGVESDNVVAQHSFKNSGSWNFFKNPLKTRVLPFDELDDGLWIDTVEQKFFDATNKPFFMGISHLYRSNNDGTEVDETLIEHIPYELEFESHYQFPNERMQQEWW